MQSKIAICVIPLCLGVTLPLLAQTVNMGVRWTDNQGNYEIQNPNPQRIRNIRVTYQRLGSTTTSDRANNLTASVCGELAPAQTCRFRLPWAQNNQTNIISIQGEVIR